MATKVLLPTRYASYEDDDDNLYRQLKSSWGEPPTVKQKSEFSKGKRYELGVCERRAEEIEVTTTGQGID